MSPEATPGNPGEMTIRRAGTAIPRAPDERHWHGATADSVFSYLSIQPVRNGTAVHWMEPV
jgi:quercetin dioxygenase-like cupin family protein